MIRALAYFGLLAVAMAAMAAEPSSGPAQTPAAPAGWDTYKILVERNIFSRDRRSVAAPNTQPAPTTQLAQPPSPVRLLVLTGVAVRNEVRIAFFEDSQSGEVIRVTPNSLLENGTVLAVLVDGVRYSSQGVERTVCVGDDLHGLPTSEPTTQSASSPSDTPAVGDSSENDIIKKMRQRRLQELKP
jgi:hypothetical protein